MTDVDRRVRREVRAAGRNDQPRGQAVAPLEKSGGEISQTFDGPATVGCDHGANLLVALAREWQRRKLRASPETRRLFQQLNAEITRAVRKVFPRPLIVKLSPNVTDIAQMARVAEDAGADALSLINTITGMAVDLATRRSKLANILFTRSLARRLEGQDITVNCLHPGAVSTNVAAKGLEGTFAGRARNALLPVEALFLKTPEEGAQTQVHCATAAGLPGGVYYDECAPAEVNPESSDAELASRLWDETAAWVGSLG